MAITGIISCAAATGSAELVLFCWKAPVEAAYSSSIRFDDLYDICLGQEDLLYTDDMEEKATRTQWAGASCWEESTSFDFRETTFGFEHRI